MSIESESVRREMLQIRHSSLYAPRDFDISLYFQIVKPSLMGNFNYKFIDWVDLPIQPLAIPQLDVGCKAQGVSTLGIGRAQETPRARLHGISDDRTRSP
jgi:hypothetical protein